MTNGVRIPVTSAFADFHFSRTPTARLGSEDIGSFQIVCDLLFVHGDAEGIPVEARRQEILDAIAKVRDAHPVPPEISVVPVRILFSCGTPNCNAARHAELFHARSCKNRCKKLGSSRTPTRFRTAAGNPGDEHELQLPKIPDV